MNILPKYMRSISMLAAGLTLTLATSCSDYFDPTPKNVMDTGEYIGEESQMYKGMLGIMNKMQQAGDQAIFLTDTRMNVLETTTKAPVALQNIYNYENTDRNEYADPGVYYSVIIACNDYIRKMEDYYNATGGMSEVAEESFPKLLSSTIRIKVWAYWMLGRIYGEAYWFDDPLNEKKPLTDTSVFTHCDMQQLTDKCLALLEDGITVAGMHISSSLTMDWYKWLDTENGNVDNFRKWQYLTPPYLLMKAELLSWRCNYESEDAAQADWLWIRDNLLEYMYKIHTAEDPAALANIQIDGRTLSIPGFESGVENMGYTYQTNIPLQSDATNAYYNIFYTEDVGTKWQVVSSIMYDYRNNQRNRLVQYFCPTFPGDGFYLKPSDYAVNTLYPQTDIRSITQRMVMDNLGGENALTKYYYAYNTDSRSYKYLLDNIFEIQPSIVLFRGHDFHYLLAEAENHLGNWDQANALLNGGLTNRFSERYDETTWPASDNVTQKGWSPYYGSWFGGRGGYGDSGLAGTACGTLYTMPQYVSDGVFTLNGQTMTEMERREYFDWCLAQEYSKEYVAEGKAYSYLCKMADRWSSMGRGDKTAAADRMAAIITPKYDAAKAAKVKASLEDKYFINWNLQDL